MESLAPLTQAIRNHFSWHEARIACLVQMIGGIFLCQSVNTYRLAGRLRGEVQFASKAQRIRRLLAKQAFDWTAVGKLLLHLSKASASTLTVLVDRTNWDFGKCSINFLVISVVVGKLAVPIVWEQLGRAGSSRTPERLQLLERFLAIVPAARIQCLLADREFIGKEWIAALHRRGIPYAIRVRENLMARHADGRAVPVVRLCQKVKDEEIRYWEWMGHPEATLAVKRLSSGELLAIVHHGLGTANPLALYRRRWRIEMLFACLKRKGFNLEDTHLTHKDRLEKIFAVAAIAAAWATCAGHQAAARTPVKKHGYAARSIFLCGIDHVLSLLLHPPNPLTVNPYIPAVG